jgi:hypothetical protein
MIPIKFSVLRWALNLPLFFLLSVPSYAASVQGDNEVEIFNAWDRPEQEQR